LVVMGFGGCWLGFSMGRYFVVVVNC